MNVFMKYEFVIFNLMTFIFVQLSQIGLYLKWANSKIIIQEYKMQGNDSSHQENIHMKSKNPTEYILSSIRHAEQPQIQQNERKLPVGLDTNIICPPVKDQYARILEESIAFFQKRTLIKQKVNILHLQMQGLKIEFVDFAKNQALNDEQKESKKEGIFTNQEKQETTEKVIDPVLETKGPPKMDSQPIELTSGGMEKNEAINDEQKESKNKVIAKKQEKQKVIEKAPEPIPEKKESAKAYSQPIRLTRRFFSKSQPKKLQKGSQSLIPKPMRVFQLSTKKFEKFLSLFSQTQRRTIKIIIQLRQQQMEIPHQIQQRNQRNRYIFQLFNRPIESQLYEKYQENAWITVTKVNIKSNQDLSGFGKK